MTGRTHTDRDYANDVLVSAAWLEAHLDRIRSEDPSLRLIEVDLNTDFYDRGHVPGAVGLDWREHLRHRRLRDVPPPERFADLLGSVGVASDSTVVVYGDNSNWLAAHLYWLLIYYGHEDVYLLDGGREYWIESGRPLTTAVPEFPERTYRTKGPFDTVRAYADDVLRAIDDGSRLVDVRLPEEFTGDVVAPPGINETARRGGHVPGAVNVVWSAGLRPDGRFKSRERLEELYRDHDVTPDDDVIVYCRVGERSSLTWFVLSELLGYPAVRNYDGSWTEWGNMVGVPIATGDGAGDATATDRPDSQ